MSTLYMVGMHEETDRFLLSETEDTSDVLKEIEEYCRQRLRQRRWTDDDE